MTDPGRIPVVVGVSGHRALRPQDRETLLEAVKRELTNLQAQVPHSPLLLLTSLAEGADLLCADAARELGVPVAVALPMEAEAYTAAFSPEDSLLIAWGSGTLQFFDLESGTEYAEPLHCQSLASAAFVGEKIVVDMGKGKLYDCAFSAFSLKEDAVEEEADASLPEKNDNTRDRIELGDHLYVSRKPSRVQLLDEAGQTLSECRIEDHFINRMCVDQKNRLIYVWYRGADRIFRIPYDPSRKTLGPLSELDTRGFEITDARETGLGLLAVTGNGSLLFYGNTDDVRPRSMKLGKDGVVRELAVNDNGLAALIISNAEAANGLNNYQFDQYFGVELWDLTMAVRLAEFEAGNKTPLSDIRITEQGRLSYDKGEEKVIWRVDAPAPEWQFPVQVRVKQVEVFFPACFRVGPEHRRARIRGDEYRVFFHAIQYRCEISGRSACQINDHLPGRRHRIGKAFLFLIRRRHFPLECIFPFHLQADPAAGQVFLQRPGLQDRRFHEKGHQRPSSGQHHHHDRPEGFQYHEYDEDPCDGQRPGHRLRNPSGAAGDLPGL